MSEHKAEVHWTRTTDDFSYDGYNRAHSWNFQGGIEVPASSAPDYLGDENRVDPEKGFVAAISSCHMLTFLAIAARKRYVVDSYVDSAVGFMEENEHKKLSVTRVELHPKIEFSGENIPTAEQIEKLHHKSHEHCFIANSVNTKVDVVS
jgi:organic hydroperoxide reductase OsmC/OhrA